MGKKKKEVIPPTQARAKDGMIGVGDYVQQLVSRLKGYVYEVIDDRHVKVHWEKGYLSDNTPAWLLKTIPKPVIERTQHPDIPLEIINPQQ